MDKEQPSTRSVFKIELFFLHQGCDQTFIAKLRCFIKILSNMVGCMWPKSVYWDWKLIYIIKDPETGALCTVNAMGKWCHVERSCTHMCHLLLVKVVIIDCENSSIVGRGCLPDYFSFVQGWEFGFQYSFLFNKSLCWIILILPLLLCKYISVVFQLNSFSKFLLFDFWSFWT